MTTQSFCRFSAAVNTSSRYCFKLASMKSPNQFPKISPIMQVFTCKFYKNFLKDQISELLQCIRVDFCSLLIFAPKIHDVLQVINQKTSKSRLIQPYQYVFIGNVLTTCSKFHHNATTVS